MPLKNRNLAIISAAIGIFAVIIYAYWSLVYAPLRQNIAKDRQQLEELESKLANAKERAKQLNRLQAEKESLNIEVVQLEKQLPKTRELPSLLRVVTHRAEYTGMTFATVQPLKPVAKGLYDEIPYQVQATGSFHALGRFLTAMGKGERLFATRNLALTSNTSKTDPTKTLNATFQLVSFKYHE